MSNLTDPVAPPAALIVTAIEGVEATAAALAKQLHLTVEVAANRPAAIRLLSRRSFSIVILDQILSESDPEGADLLWKTAGLAIPLQFSFALSGGARLEREVRAALARRHREQQLASTAATAAVDAELKNAVTGLLLESQLALAEQGVPPALKSRLQTMAAILDRLRQWLGCEAALAAVSVIHPAEPHPAVPKKCVSSSSVASPTTLVSLARVHE